jgi:hypothetical protein
MSDASHQDLCMESDAELGTLLSYSVNVVEEAHIQDEGAFTMLHLARAGLQTAVDSEIDCATVHGVGMYCS